MVLIGGLWGLFNNSSCFSLICWRVTKQEVQDDKRK